MQHKATHKMPDGTVMKGAKHPSKIKKEKMKKQLSSAYDKAMKKEDDYLN